MSEWVVEEKGIGGGREGEKVRMGMIIMKKHFICVWKSRGETHYIV